MPVRVIERRAHIVATGTKSAVFLIVFFVYCFVTLLAQCEHRKAGISISERSSSTVRARRRVRAQRGCEFAPVRFKSLFEYQRTVSARPTSQDFSCRHPSAKSFEQSMKYLRSLISKYNEDYVRRRLNIQDGKKGRHIIVTRLSEFGLDGMAHSGNRIPLLHCSCLYTCVWRW